MRLQLKAFASSIKGTMAMSLGLAAPVLMGVAGLAVDYGMAVQKRASLQELADAAAVAAAAEYATVSGNTTKLSAIAGAYVEAKKARFDNALTAKVQSVDKQGSVSVTLEHKWQPIFAHFFNAGMTPIVASSTARSVGSGKICMLALRPFANKALHVLRDATLIADGCAVYSNSKHNHSIWIDQNGSVAADLICAAGGVKYKKASSVKPAVTEDCTPMADPLASRPAPPSDACPRNALQQVITDQITTLSPGTYCGGLRIEGNSQVKLAPGVYVFKNGPFQVVGSAALKGENVGFFFTGSNATLLFEGKTSIAVTAPKSGPMAGLLMYEDRAAAKGNVHIINSDDARVLLGTIYFPNGTLRVAANAPVADQSAYTAIIAEMLDLDAGPDLVLRSDYGATDIPVPAGLIGGRVVLTD